MDAPDSHLSTPSMELLHAARSALTRSISVAHESTDNGRASVCPRHTNLPWVGVVVTVVVAVVVCVVVIVVVGVVLPHKCGWLVGHTLDALNTLHWPILFLHGPAVGLPLFGWQLSQRENSLHSRNPGSQVCVAALYEKQRFRLSRLHGPLPPPVHSLGSQLVTVGALVGCAVGTRVGAAVGDAVGAVGLAVGAADGAAVGVADGDAVGAAVGAADGAIVGTALGAAVGGAVPQALHLPGQSRVALPQNVRSRQNTWSKTEPKHWKQVPHVPGQ